MNPRQFLAYPPADRFALAKSLTDKLVDYMISLIALNESNKIVLKSDILSKQIPRSRAANAFNNFRLSMAGYEVVRLCACWEKPDLNDASIQTVIKLIDDINVRKEITSAVFAGNYGNTDPGARNNIALAMSQDLNKKIDNTIYLAKNVMLNPRLESVLNHRHKYFAHNLVKTRREEKGTVAPMKNDDYDWLFEETKSIINGLHHGINRAGFDWAGAHEISKRQAEALWHGTRFIDLI